MRRTFAALAVLAATTAVLVAQRAAAPAASNSGITTVAGIKVGQYTMPGRPTGCTVVIVDGEGAVGGRSTVDPTAVPMHPRQSFLEEDMRQPRS